MGWFKKPAPCSQCAKEAAKRKFEGQPMCGACIARVLAEREGVRKCPVDGASLTKSVSNEIVIDRCPTCDGVWLDAGEIETIKDAAHAEGMAVGMVVF